MVMYTLLSCCGARPFSAFQKSLNRYVRFCTIVPLAAHGERFRRFWFLFWFLGWDSGKIDLTRVRKKGSFGKGVFSEIIHFLEILEILEILEL